MKTKKNIRMVTKNKFKKSTLKKKKRIEVKKLLFIF